MDYATYDTTSGSYTIDVAKLKHIQWQQKLKRFAIRFVTLLSVLLIIGQALQTTSFT